MGAGYAGPGWEWPKGRDFDCTASCCVTVGNKSIETITGGNFASRMRHNQHHVQRQQLCPPMGGPVNGNLKLYQLWDFKSVPLCREVWG